MNVVTPSPMSPIESARTSWSAFRSSWKTQLTPPSLSDARYSFAFLLALYATLGTFIFGFNRSPWQMLFIVVSGAVLDVIFSLIAKKSAVFPLSAFISCTSLAILLNYAHGSLLPLFPVLLFIFGKYVLTINDRHVLNPSMFAVATSLLLGNDMITTAPAYQWNENGIATTLFLIVSAALVFMHRIGRTWLVVSFLFFYAVQTAIRAYVMRYHLPPEMLFIGTMTTPPFFLFTMYMLTDPQTSPKTPRGQIFAAFAIASIDLVLHLKQSVFTFFYAALIFGLAKFAWLHLVKVRDVGFVRYVKEEVLSAARLRALAAISLCFAAYAAALSWASDQGERDVKVHFRTLPTTQTGLASTMGDVFHEVDPRVQHIAKWVLSVGDAIAIGDVDGDGLDDIFVTQPLKVASDRAALMLNRSSGGVVRFERFPLEHLTALFSNPKQNGLPSGANLIDYDGDGDIDLFVSVGFGKSRLLKNMRSETGQLSFLDVSSDVGINAHTISLQAVWFDVDNDADLDLLVLNALPTELPDYAEPTPLNIFDLPQPQYEGDRRMFRFMHNGWHDANNGGLNFLYLQDQGKFTRVDNAQYGLTQTRWSLACVTIDFNHDGFTDLYIANDFGPDDLLINRVGKRFERKVGGPLFNAIGNDTYKGMNASVGDVDRNGFMDIYVSNVHQALQAEGSLLYMGDVTAKGEMRFRDEASRRGALNPHRFAWGAAIIDVDLDGYEDIVQANGMVDDRLDKLLADDVRKDYWYVNHKLMQSGPSVHTYADMWGDIRGRTIYPNEARRLLLNGGADNPGHFVDVAETAGIADKDNSRGVGAFDFENDGDLDLIITNQHGPLSVYQSDLRDVDASKTHFVCVNLVGDGVRDARLPVGSAIEVAVNQTAFRQELTTMAGFAAQNDSRLRIGLGDYDKPDVLVRVSFLHGPSVTLQLPVDRCVTVLERDLQ